MIHSRLPHTVELPISKIAVELDSMANDRLVQLYCRLHKGEIKAAFTRLPISTITSGYYDRRTDGNMHISNLRSEDVSSLERMIRGGSRPTLDLYWDPLGPGGGRYVCADDETSLAAYLKLNFVLVPCKILKPRRADASEASIWVEKRGEHVSLAKAVAPTLDKYASFFGGTLPPFSELARILTDKCKDTRAAILAFNEDDGAGVHYHQMLHALLRRHERILDSICRLITLGRAEHAGALTRVAYEAFLNFYIDWLSPEFFGPRLQLLSSIPAARGPDKKLFNDNLTVLSNFVEFLEKTSEKARISPLGAFFHSSIYPPLSLVAHQSYMHLQQEASDFDDTDSVDPSSRVEQLGRWLDVLTAALLIRVRNDIGATTSRSDSC